MGRLVNIYDLQDELDVEALKAELLTPPYEQLFFNFRGQDEMFLMDAEELVELRPDLKQTVRKIYGWDVVSVKWNEEERIYEVELEP